MTEFAAAIHGLYAVAAMIVGLFLCFYGERWFKVLCCTWGFVMGGLAGFAIATGPFGITAPVWLFMVTLGFAAIGAIILAISIYINIFLMGFQLGAIICAVPVVLATGGPVAAASVGSVVIFGGGLVGGIIALLWRKVVLIVATAIVGAALVISGFTLGIVSLAHVSQTAGGGLIQETLNTMLSSTGASIVSGLCVLLVAILGFAGQYRSLRKRELLA